MSQHEPLPLYGAQQVAERLGVTVSNLRYVRNLPEPVAELAPGSRRRHRVWWAPDIDEFAEVRKQRKHVTVGVG